MAQEAPSCTPDQPTTGQGGDPPAMRRIEGATGTHREIGHDMR